MPPSPRGGSEGDETYSIAVRSRPAGASPVSLWDSEIKSVLTQCPWQIRSRVLLERSVDAAVRQRGCIAPKRSELSKQVNIALVLTPHPTENITTHDAISEWTASGN